MQSPYGAAGCFKPATASSGPVLDTTLATCDTAGFPNGRRPGDDVVDVSIRVAMGFLLDSTHAPFGGVPFVDGAANNASTGGATPTASANFLTTFPYLNTPVPGAP
jgi:hypothetical protein